MTVSLMKESAAVLRMVPMADYTSWRVGGPADLFCRPRSLDELTRFLESIPTDAPLTFIGLGSNLLVRDGGIRGAVVCTSGLPRTMDRLDGGRVRASAGLPCATLARRCARLGIGPAAFFAGIPGTVGGALAMNAGAFGGETWDRVLTVETIDRSGSVKQRARAEFEIAYRTVRGLGEQWFVGAEFGFDAARAGEAQNIQDLLASRSRTQPLGKPSAGSVFRNPEGGHAGQLIEDAGLKGFRIGGAVVSELHANFIINTGTASAADIEALIFEIQRRVSEQAGIRLEPEVRILGEPAEALE